MLSERQIQERIENTKKCVNALLGEKLTTYEIEEKYKIPSSTVQRYLNNEKVLKEIYGIDAEFVISQIKEVLSNNKNEGVARGGINSQINNGYAKDENGKFTGSGRKR